LFKNKAAGVILSNPYNEQYFKSNKLFISQPLLPFTTYKIASPEQPLAMEEHTIEIPEVTVIGNQEEKVYKDEYEKMYEAVHVKSLDYEPLCSSSSLETAIVNWCIPL